ncbi:MAG: hydantoinase/oxoprolinase family protein [Deltaproteobacteria bacterium]
MSVRAGLDVGGAHLKVACAEDGRLTAVRQIPCPLWMGLAHLDVALQNAAPLLAEADTVAITMTGELSDVFTDRITGVETLVDRLSKEFGGRARFWTGSRGMRSAEDARRHPRDVGSTNFLASAALTGYRIPDALLIDFGSTTADIIPIRKGTPVPTGLTDAMRQTTGELVYTGYTRTAVMAVTGLAPFQGQWVTLAREYLATMADVRRILGVDLNGIDQHVTADGKDKSLASSKARLARMLGRDAAEGSAADWRTAAVYVREMQLRSIHDGAIQVLSQAALPGDAPVVAAGVGARDVADIAARLERPVISFAELAGADGDLEFWAAACAPAVALALMPD